VTTPARIRSSDAAASPAERIAGRFARVRNRIAEAVVKWTRRSRATPSAAPRCEPTVWLVDGYNVLHAAVLRGRDRSRWWTGERRRELLERVCGFAADAEVWVVFDGPDDSKAASDPRGPHCVFASSADAWLVDRVRTAADPAKIAVVTSDRQVAGRARGRGARVVSPRDFMARCAREAADAGAIDRDRP